MVDGYAVEISPNVGIERGCDRGHCKAEVSPIDHRRGWYSTPQVSRAAVVDGGSRGRPANPRTAQIRTNKAANPQRNNSISRRARRIPLANLQQQAINSRFGWNSRPEVAPDQ